MKIRAMNIQQKSANERQAMNIQTTLANEKQGNEYSKDLGK